ncbi:hypothetical protein GOODEAATRI_007622 [Goodea atripinnis]|uniref:Uncharacterized protein n=1 Tax=Goodea atripinnis TaxID=208336 RepID=A0ABV0MQ39_9TELE
MEHVYSTLQPHMLLNYSALPPMWYLGFETSVPLVSFGVNDCSMRVHSHTQTVSYSTHTLPLQCAAVVMTAFSPATDLICKSNLHISQHPSERGDCVTFLCSAVRETYTYAHRHTQTHQLSLDLIKQKLKKKEKE